MSLGYLRAGDVRAAHWAKDRVALTIPGMDDIRYHVRVASSLDTNQKYATLVHELAHVYCGHVGKKTEDWWPDRHGKLKHGQRELEAEGVSFIVCGRRRLVPRSAEYLANHIDEDDFKHISIDAMLRAATRVQEMSGWTAPKTKGHHSVVGRLSG